MSLILGKLEKRGKQGVSSSVSDLILHDDFLQKNYPTLRATMKPLLNTYHGAILTLSFHNNQNFDHVA